MKKGRNPHTLSPLLVLSLLLFLTMFSQTAFGKKNEQTESGQFSRVVDEAGLLSTREEEKLEEELAEISERQQCDVAVVTVNGLNGRSARNYADDFYDEHGYGMGADADGILLLIGMETREWYITTCGFGARALTDDGITYISEKFLPNLSDGDYADAFKTYADLCDQFLTQAKKGTSYDGSRMPKEKMGMIWIPISAAIGFVLALLTAGAMRMQLKSVRSQTAAASYIKPGSRKLRVSRDIFLYRNVIKRERPKEHHEGGGGGSSMHTSSSGRSHGGSGGHF